MWYIWFGEDVPISVVVFLLMIPFGIMGVLASSPGGGYPRTRYRFPKQLDPTDAELLETENGAIDDD